MADFNGNAIISKSPHFTFELMCLCCFLKGEPPLLFFPCLFFFLLILLLFFLSQPIVGQIHTRFGKPLGSIQYACIASVRDGPQRPYPSSGSSRLASGLELSCKIDN